MKKVIRIGLVGVFVLSMGVAVQAINLTAYFPFDTDLVDVVGGNNGVSGNESHATISGRDALNLNPGGSQVVVAGSGWSGNAFANDTLAVSFWQLDGQDSNSSTFWGIAPGEGAGDRGFQAHVPWGNGTIYFDTSGCCSGPSQRMTTGIANGNDGNWHHFVFNKDGATKEIWKDGLMLASQGGATDFDFAFTSLIIGAQNAGGTNRLTGYLDDMAWFDEALTGDEIRRLASGEGVLSVAGLGGGGVPEPATMVLTLLGAAGLIGRRRRVA